MFNKYFIQKFLMNILKMFNEYFIENFVTYSNYYISNNMLQIDLQCFLINFLIYLSNKNPELRYIIYYKPYINFIFY